jgi:RimJ/RimL family protein N-acetyltransferase
VTPADGRALPLPAPRLVDGALSLRPWSLDDAAALAAAWADPEVACWTGVPPVRDEAAAAGWIAGDELRRSSALSLDLVIDVGGVVAGEVGLIGLSDGRGIGELGWWVGPDHRGQGLATRAVRLVVTWALDTLGVEVLEARCHPDNPASGAVAAAAGLLLAGVDGEVPVEIWRVGPGAGDGKVSA